MIAMFVGASHVKHSGFEYVNGRTYRIEIKPVEPITCSKGAQIVRVSDPVAHRMDCVKYRSIEVVNRNWKVVAR